MPHNPSTPSDERIRRFAIAYMRYGNCALAYRASCMQGESKASDVSARNHGSDLLREPRTQAMLQKLREKAAEKAVTSIAEWICNELKLARSDIARLFDEEGRLLPLHEIDEEMRAAIQSIDIEEEKVEIRRAEGVETITRSRVKKIKLHSKDGAQDRLAKHLGAYAKDNDQKRTPYEEALRALHGLSDAAG